MMRNNSAMFASVYQCVESMGGMGFTAKSRAGWTMPLRDESKLVRITSAPIGNVRKAGLDGSWRQSLHANEWHVGTSKSWVKVRSSTDCL